MASDTSLVFNLIAKDRVTKALNPLAARLTSLGKGLEKALMVGGAAAPLASVAVTAASVAAGGVAMGAAFGAFSLAAKPQITAVQDALTLYEATLDNTGQKTKAAKAEQDKYNAALSKMPKPVRDVTKGIIGLKNDYQKWSDKLSKPVMGVFAKGINLARTILPKLTPLVKVGAREFGIFIDRLDKGAKSKGFTEWINNLAKTAGPTLRNVLAGTTNLAVGIGNLVGVFSPGSKDISSGLLDMTKKFKDWTAGLEGSAGFQKFLDFADQGGQTLTQLGTTIGIVVTALQPFAGSALIIATALASIIAATPPGVVTAIGQAWITAAIGMRVWSAAQAGVSAGKGAITVAKGIGTATKSAYRGTMDFAAGLRSAQAANSAFTGKAGDLGGKVRGVASAMKSGAVAAGQWVASTARAGAAAVATGAKVAAQTAKMVIQKGVSLAIRGATLAWAGAQQLLNLAMSMNPVGLVIAGVAALIAIVVVCYKKFPAFRHVVQAAMRGAAAAFKWVMDAGKKVFNWIKSHWGTISKILMGPMGIAFRWIKSHWDDISSGGRKVLGWIRGAWNGVNKYLITPFKTGVSAIKKKFSELTSWFSGLKSKFRSIGSSIVDGLKNGISAKWNSVVGWVKGLIAKLPSAAQKVLGISSPSRVFHKLGMHVAEGMSRGIRRGWSGVLSALDTGLKGVQKKYDTAKSKLSATKSAWSQQYTAVRDAFKGQGIVERGTGVGEIMGSMATQAQQEKRMLAVLKSLKKKGLAKSLLSQLAQAGPEALGQAESILASGTTGVRELNRLQSSITKSAKAAGKFSANDQYAKALKEQAKDAKHLARDIRELTRAIKYAKRRVGKNALGTSSWRGGVTWVGEDGPELVDLPGGTRIMPRSQARAAMAPIPSGGGRPQRVVLELRGTDKVLLEMLRKAVRNAGGNVQVVLGAS